MVKPGLGNHGYYVFTLVVKLGIPGKWNFDFLSKIWPYSFSDQKKWPVDVSGWKKGLKLTFFLKYLKKWGLKSIFSPASWKRGFKIDIFSQCLEKGGLYSKAYPSPSHNEYPPGLMRTHMHTHAGNDNTRRPKLVLGKNGIQFRKISTSSFSYDSLSHQHISDNLPIVTQPLRNQLQRWKNV